MDILLAGFKITVLVFKILVLAVGYINLGFGLMLGWNGEAINKQPESLNLPRAMFLVVSGFILVYLGRS